MKTLGLSKLGLNPENFYYTLLNKQVNMEETFEVETIDFKKSYDFILFDGGSDVTPSYYHELPHKETFNNLERDKHEEEIFLSYLGTKTKYIGICRGSQFLNVMMGGNLYQNLSDYGKQHYPLHNIKLTKECAEFLLLPETVTVNSTHHQAVRNLGKNLVAKAVDTEYNIIEMYQSSHGDKIRAVQFHPEDVNFFYYARVFVQWLFRYL